MKKKLISIIMLILIILSCIFYINIMQIKNILINSSYFAELYIKLVRKEKNFDAEHVITFLDNGMPIIVNKYDRCVCRFVRLTGHWDSDEARVINKLVKKDFKIIEVGSNFGVYTLQMAKLIGKNGKIYAFEANPKVSKYLKKSIEMNNLTNTIELHQKAAGETKGKVFLDFNITNIGAGHLVPTPNEHSIQTEIVRINDTLDVQKIDFIKIDAEGCENKILRGASKILAANPDIILMLEWSPELLKKQGTDHEFFINYFIKSEFRLWRIGRKIKHEPLLVPITYEELSLLKSGDIVASRKDLTVHF